MSGFPSRKELEQLIGNGLKCSVCNKNSAEIGNVFGAWSIVKCKECKEEYDKKNPYKPDNSMGSSKVNSVFTDEKTGALIPVNEKGNVIRGEPQYHRKKNERPLW